MNSFRPWVWFPTDAYARTYSTRADLQQIGSRVGYIARGMAAMGCAIIVLGVPPSPDRLGSGLAQRSTRSPRYTVGAERKRA